MLVDLVDELGLDGVNVDVERLPVEHVLDYGGFVGRLREALRGRAPDAQVSVATQANELGAAMAAAAAADGADRIFLMGYDYHWAGSEPGASAPIDRLDGEQRDLVWSLDLYAALGVPVERTILGLPLYGMTWPVIGPGSGRHRPDAGDSWVPRRNLGSLRGPDVRPRCSSRSRASSSSGAVPGTPASPVRPERRPLGPAARRGRRRGLRRSTTTRPGVSPRNSPWPTNGASPAPASGRSATSAACRTTRS